MAETIGILLSLASLYSGCVQAFEQIHAARSLSRDYEILYTRFDVKRTRLLQWGEGVGLMSSDASERHPYLGKANVQSTIERVLLCVKMLLTDAENLQIKYGMIQTPTGQNRDPSNPQSDLVVSARRARNSESLYRQFQAKLRKHQKDTSFVQKMQWAITGRAGFEKLVADLGDLTNDLYQIVPVMPSFERLMIKEDLDAVQDLNALRRVAEACGHENASDVRERWISVTSACIEASEASTRAQECVAVVEWLATCENGSQAAEGPAISSLSSSSDHNPTSEVNDDILSIMSRRSASTTPAASFHDTIIERPVMPYSTGLATPPRSPTPTAPPSYQSAWPVEGPSRRISRILNDQLSALQTRLESIGTPPGLDSLSCGGATRPNIQIHQDVSYTCDI